MVSRATIARCGLGVACGATAMRRKPWHRRTDGGMRKRTSGILIGFLSYCRALRGRQAGRRHADRRRTNVQTTSRARVVTISWSRTTPRVVLSALGRLSFSTSAFGFTLAVNTSQSKPNLGFFHNSGATGYSRSPPPQLIVRRIPVLCMRQIPDSPVLSLSCWRCGAPTEATAERDRRTHRTRRWKTVVRTC